MNLRLLAWAFSKGRLTATRNVAAICQTNAGHITRLHCKAVVILGWLVIAGALLPLPGWSQNNQRLQTLQRKLAAATADSTRAILLTDIGFETVDADPQKALQYFLQAEALSEKSGYKTAMLHVYDGKGTIMDYASNFDSAFYYYDQGLALAEKLKNGKWQSIFHVNKGLIYLRQNKHPEAMQQYDMAQRIAEQATDDNQIADILRKKANLVLQDFNYKRAKEYYRQAIAIHERQKDSGRLGETTGSLGFAYRNEGRYDSAIFYFEKANVIFKALRYTNMIAVAYTEIGKAHFEQQQYREALKNYTAAEKIYDTLHYMQHQDALHVFIGDALIELKDAAAARVHYDKALQLARDSKDREQESEAIYGLFKVSRDGQDFRNAVMYLQSYDSMKDVLAKAEQMDKVVEMTERFETVKKERTIQQQRFELVKKNYWIWGSAGLLLLLTLLGYSYYRRYRLKKEKQLQQEIMHQQDLATRAVLQAEEKERQRIALELHDGVGQMMSVAKMNLSAFETELAGQSDKQRYAFEKIIGLVDESCREVRAVSHQMMPNALLKSGLASAIRDFIEKLDNNVLKVNLYSEGLNERLNPDVEAVLYRVVQECVNNVVKHSAANHLDISLIRDADGLSITIEDNGKGFDGASSSYQEGIGLQNIRSRVQYLKGTVEWDSAVGQGTLVAIHIPTRANASKLLVGCEKASLHVVVAKSCDECNAVLF